MKFEVLRTDLEDAVNRISDSIATSDLVDMFLKVFISVDEDGFVILRASNNNLLMETKFICEDVSKPGAVCVPGRHFAGMPKLWRGERVNVRTTGNYLMTQCGSSKMKLIADKDAHFIDFPEYDIAFTMNESFLDPLKKVAVSSSREAAMLSLKGVYLTLRKKKMHLAASNSIAINMFTEKMKKSIKGADNLLLPSGLIDQFISMGPSEFRFFITDNWVGAEVDSDGTMTRLCHRQNATSFADLDSFVEQWAKREFAASIRVPRKKLVNVFTRSEFTIDENDKIISIKFIPKSSKGGRATVSASSGLVKVTGSELFTFKGGIKREITIRVAPGYLLDFLKVAENDWIDLKFLGTNLPFCFKERGHVYWVSPISVSVDGPKKKKKKKKNS